MWSRLSWHSMKTRCIKHCQKIKWWSLLDKIINYFLFFFLKILFICRERGREKEREKNINVWLPFTCPDWGPGLQPRRVPWLGIKLATLWFATHAQSTELHQPGLMFFFMISWVVFGLLLCSEYISLLHQRKESVLRLSLLGMFFSGGKKTCFVLQIVGYILLDDWPTSYLQLLSPLTSSYMEVRRAGYLLSQTSLHLK